jgi:DNA gyrase/topoisomerase IV subunit B
MDEKRIDIAVVRERPGMFVGATDGTGVLHMVLELVANAFDQHLAGRCSRISIEIASEARSP